jgi:5-methylcytosine-specific restriction enzyme subunit McrC
VHFTHLNRHYERAIRLARMILSGTSFELGDGSVRARGFLINMNWMFEEFVQVALREALHEPASRFGTWTLYFDEAEETALKPDLMWAPHGALGFVGDLKYKIIDDRPNPDDLYQMLAYIVAANLSSGMLIYPKVKNQAEAISLRVANIGRTIEIRTLDISAEPSEILTSIARIAARVRAMAKHVYPDRARA